jgi:PilZ domain
MSVGLIADTHCRQPSNVMHSTEKRKNVRRAITYPAFLEFGDGLPARECTLCDASQEGAQLVVAEPNSLPEEFILALSSDGAARRRCRVIWRTENQIGVEFVKDRKKAPTPMPTRMRRPEPAAAPQNAEASAEPPANPVDIDTLTPR